MASTNDIIKATCRMTGDDNVAIQNVLQFRCNTLFGGTDNEVMDDLAEFLDDLYDGIAPYISDQVQFVDIQFFNKTTGNPMGVRSWPTQTTGGDSGDALPSGVSPLVVLQTGINRTIGRKFLPQVGVGEIVNGNWGSAFVSAMAAYGAQLLGAFIASSLNIYLPGITDKNGLFWAFVSAVVSGEPAYQRRRRAGTGI